MDPNEKCTVISNKNERTGQDFKEGSWLVVAYLDYALCV